MGLRRRVQDNRLLRRVEAQVQRLLAVGEEVCSHPAEQRH
jgi:hypothetical protein